jgi:hypothetical protein
VKISKGSTVPRIRTIKDELRYLTDEELKHLIEVNRKTTSSLDRTLQWITVTYEHCKPGVIHSEFWGVLVGEVRAILMEKKWSECFLQEKLVLVPFTEVAIVYHRGQGGTQYFNVLYIFTTTKLWRTVKLGEPVTP